MLLTDKAVKNAKPKEKSYRLKDGDGLFLQVEPIGSRYWRLRYFFNGKEKMLALGTYPEVTLAEAREKRLEARKQVQNGIDPSAQKKENKRIAALNASNTFKAIALEWLEANKSRWIESHAQRILRRLELHVFPELGDLPIKEIRPMDVLAALRKVEKKGATHQSHRAHQVAASVFRYAIITGRLEFNPAADLQGALKAHTETHYPTLQAKELPEFFKRLEAAVTSRQNKLAIYLLMLTFVRQGELRQSKWEDFDMEAQEWTLPAETTKMRNRHIVPLSTQALAILKELKNLTGHSPYLFPTQSRHKNPIISENTINQVLHKMGYKGKLVGHGFRALASTVLNEEGFRPDIIERQLAHIERNKVRAAYNRAEYLDDRRKMMQWWGDYIQRQATGESK